jgi:sec-independent protein translocase protein TatC
MSQAEKQLTVRDHLEEFRRRLMISAIAVLIGTAVAFMFHRQALKVLMEPARNILEPLGTSLVYTQLTEMLGISMKVSLVGGLVLSLPVVIYELLMFVAPGLTAKERRYLLIALPGLTAAFITGIAFGYFVLIPPAIKFLLQFNSDIAAPLIRIGNYISVIVTLLFWLGLVFETPLFMFVLAKLRVVTHKTFARWRRLALVVAFVLGAIITPTFDPINQSLVAIPIVLLYEVGIWLAWLARRGEKRVAVDASEASG